MIAFNPKEQKAIEVLRDFFISQNDDLINRIDEYKKTGCFKCNAYSHDYIFKDFFQVLENGFRSILLKNIFESMMHILFIRVYYNVPFDIKKYIKKDTLNEEDLLKDARNMSKVYISVDIIERYLKRELKKLKIKDFSFLEDNRDSNENLESMLHSIKYGKRTGIEYKGDYKFLISRIPKTGKSPKDLSKCVLNDNIFYTYKPEQIINMSYASKPGIYLIANVPYGRMHEAAFYFLIVTDQDSYIVENNKHSYRDQIYRGKTDGTKGEDAWLGRRYEYTYLPIEDVIDFFNNRSDGKDVIVKDKEFSFKQIKKLSESDPLNLLWCLSFTDNCIKFLEDNELEKNIKTSCSFSLIDKKISNSRQLPAVYKSSVPTISEMDPQWDPEMVEVNKKNSGNYLQSDIKSLSIKEMDLNRVPTYLTSIDQIKCHLLFEKRKQEAKELQERLYKDFYDNHEKVINKIASQITGNIDIIIKAFENKLYPCTVYTTFGRVLKDLKKTEGYGILYEEENYSTVKRVFETPHLQYSRYNNFNSVSLYPRQYNYKQEDCNLCKKNYVKLNYILQFADVVQVQEFFDNNLDLPDQMIKYLNLASTMYNGNHILYDVDPVALIHNPWWVDNFFHNEISHKWHSFPRFSITFRICKRCRNKLMKRHTK